MLKKSLVAAAAITLSTISLTACGSSGSDSSGGSDEITMGFAQVGAESGWRTANTKSIKETAEERRAST